MSDRMVTVIAVVWPWFVLGVIVTVIGVYLDRTEPDVWHRNIFRFVAIALWTALRISFILITAMFLGALRGTSKSTQSNKS